VVITSYVFGGYVETLSGSAGNLAKSIFDRPARGSIRMSGASPPAAV
jgi:hypothetical protein